MPSHQSLIEAAFAERATLTPQTAPRDLVLAVQTVLDDLDHGHLRVAEKIDGEWITHTWIKQAILLSFKLFENKVIEGEFTRYFDKMPLKFQADTFDRFTQAGVRVVPPAVARYGSFLAPNVVLMPAYVNVGAYVDRGTLIDTWATVGSCAQIGRNVHLSGGAGIGGVLEPLQANPTIIEDDCFIGARSEIVEGVIVEAGSVISMGVYLGQSTRIYDRETGTISYGRIPAGSVVVPGSVPSANGDYSLYAAIIVKKVDAVTRGKVGLNELLRDIE